MSFCARLSVCVFLNKANQTNDNNSNNDNTTNNTTNNNNGDDNDNSNNNDHTNNNDNDISNHNNTNDNTPCPGGAPQHLHRGRPLAAGDGSQSDKQNPSTLTLIAYVFSCVSLNELLSYSYFKQASSMIHCILM